MEFTKFSAKTVNEAITEACQQFSVPSDKLEYEVIDEGSTGFLGFNAKPAIINARVKEEEIIMKSERGEEIMTLQKIESE